MHNHEDHVKTWEKASDRIKLEKAACTQGWSGSCPPFDPFLILWYSAPYPPGLTPEVPGPASRALVRVWTTAGTRETGGREEGRGQDISPLWGRHF